MKEKAKRQLSSKEGDLRAAESMFQIPERKEQWVTNKTTVYKYKLGSGAGESEWLLQPAPRPATGVDPPRWQREALCYLFY